VVVCHVTDKKIDIVINERGASTVTRDINLLADITQKLSPAMARSLRGAALRIGLNTTALVDAVAVAALETVVRASPRDSGQFRGAWQTFARVSRSPSEGRYGNLDYSGEATIAEGTAVIKGSSPRPDGTSIIISNGMPYGPRLNEGWSSQAAAGFVERAVQSARNTVSNANLLGKK
jgi:hypothetical protein